MLSSTATTPDPASPAADNAPIERARPLLGTFVSLRIDGLTTGDAHALADDAFAEIALIHRLMSFQDTASDLNRINREAAHRPVALHPHTRACLSHAIDLARRSSGAFDPVRAGGSWLDVTLDGEAVRTATPLSIDLSGIAKGYAVDRACEILLAGGAMAAIVNAGGDMRVFGSEESVMLRPSGKVPPAMLALRDGAMASSDPALSRAETGCDCHFDGRNARPVDNGFAAVCAPACVDADALTKVVLALKDDAIPLLQAAGATGYVHDAHGWRIIGGPA